jgi:hypothetical protein
VHLFPSTAKTGLNEVQTCSSFYNLGWVAQLDLELVGRGRLHKVYNLSTISSICQVKLFSLLFGYKFSHKIKKSQNNETLTKKSMS